MTYHTQEREVICSSGKVFVIYLAVLHNALDTRSFHKHLLNEYSHFMFSLVINKSSTCAHLRKPSCLTHAMHTLVNRCGKCRVAEIATVLVVLLAAQSVTMCKELCCFLLVGPISSP